MRIRREPPPFRRVEVARTEALTPRMTRVTFTGAELAGLEPGLPTGNIRLLLPQDGAGELVLPAWNGNEFLHADGRRPVLRSYTPRTLRGSGADVELDVDVVIHDGGAVSAWALGAAPGDPAGVAGMGRGYAVPEGADGFLLAGDESAIPAMSVLLEVLPPVPVQVVVEAATADAVMGLPDHPGAAVEWHVLAPDAAPGSAMLAEVEVAEIGPATFVWVAGEAAGVQRIRKLLFEERGMPRSQASVRGYWKIGAAGGEDE